MKSSASKNFVGSAAIKLFAFLLIKIKTLFGHAAPLGYEDETGFHIGTVER